LDESPVALLQGPPVVLHEISPPSARRGAAEKAGPAGPREPLSRELPTLQRPERSSTTKADGEDHRAREAAPGRGSCAGLLACRVISRRG
jgi:hypothetical protein